MHSWNPPIASQVPMPANANWHDIVVRRACPMAREIFYEWNMAQVDQNPELIVCGSCVTCGQPTGNYCDPCMFAGRTFVVPSGQVMSGTPVCTQCEGLYCYVCVGLAPPGPVGQPTVPVVMIGEQ